MNTDTIPEPSVMPVDRDKWGKELGLSNFINTYYQFRDIDSLGNFKKILIIGPGQGLDKCILQWRGYDVTTLDIDPAFKPDFIGSIHDLSMFSCNQFDVVVASHVLEHIAEPYLDSAIKECARVGKYSIIYLPVHGKHFQWRFMSGSQRIDLFFIMDIFNYFKKSDGKSPRYMDGQHFWEVGIIGFKVKDLKKRFSNYFHIEKIYRNKDWLPSINFILKSKINP